MTRRNSVLWKRSILGSAVILSAGLMLATGNTGGAKTEDAGKRYRLSGFDAPPAVRDIVLRACADCHSEETKWPWYSNLPPVSWQIHSDVDDARAVMNLSRWNEYSDEERHDFATQIAGATRVHVMPPRKYLWMHHDAKLSSVELDVLNGWAKQ
jgi:mono/diheme cytochrome c family protein